MLPFFLCPRGATITMRRLQLARFFFTAAVLVALTPTSSLAFITHGCSRRHTQLTPSSALASKHCPIRTCPGLSISSLSVSASDTPTPTTSGSSAVRSMKPLPLPTDTIQLQLLSFYNFVPISQPENIRDTLFERLKTIEGLRGSVYVAKEGINAQFAVPVGEPLDELLNAFRKRNRGSDDEDGNIHNIEGGCLPFDTFEKNPPNMGNVVDIDTPTFDRLIVRTRDCILRDGMDFNFNGEENDSILDWSDAGKELDPSEWDEQLSRRLPNNQNNIQLLDCRNAYESDQGSFVSAKPLNTQTFSDTWSILDSQVESKSLDPSEPVYIFCTGGIRCVKVGAYLKQRLGFDDVRSLKHGIIGYEKWVGEGPERDDETDSSNNDNSGDEQKQSLWVGENFLFDKRRFAKEGGENSDKEASI